MPTWCGHTTSEGSEGTHVERPGRALVFWREDEVEGRPCIVRASRTYSVRTRLCAPAGGTFISFRHIAGLNADDPDMNMEIGGW